jgi:DNA-binding beta-propeller fold protein YncE
MVMRRILVAVLPAILAVACGSVGQDLGPTASTSPAAARPNDVLVLGSADGTRVIDTTGRVVADLGHVVGAPGWTVAFASETASTGNTALRVIDARTGKTTRTVQLTGRWSPVAGYGDGPSGVSPSGHWLVLAVPKADRAAFQIIDTTGAAQPKRVELAGRFSFDAISDDGNSLFVVERLEGTKYRVRVADVATGLLVSGAVVDVKQAATTADENGVMSGSYTTATAGPSGEWYFSVYQHPTKGPYIHALNTQHRYAECILDLPTFGSASAVEMAKQPFWSLAVGRERQGTAQLYAVNGALGQLALVDPYGIKVMRSTTFKVPTPAPGPAAFAPQGGAAVSPDGYRLYALGETGIFLIDTTDLSLRATFAQASAFRGLAVSPDNATLYALAADGRTISVLDARTGRPAGTVGLSAAADSIAIQKP